MLRHKSRGELYGDVKLAVLVPDFFRNALGAFADASRRFGIERFPSRELLHYRIEVGQNLGVGVRGFG